MNQIEVITVFLEEGYQISPNAVELICCHCNPRSLVNRILKNMAPSVLVVDIEHIDEHINENSFQEKYEVPVKQSLANNLPAIPKIIAPIGSAINPVHSDNPVDVLLDITDNSTCVGEYMEFVQFFRNRYSRLSEMIRGRLNSRPIESLNKYRNKGIGRREGMDKDMNEVSIIGMVSDIKSTSNGHKMIELEDTTGSISVLVRMADKELFELASRFILDEVIGITGALTNDGKLLIAKKITIPDLPNTLGQRRRSYGKAVLTSDVHIGSSTFLEEQWYHFIDFLKGDTDNEAMAALSKEVRYLVVAGDLVDGVGIYPGQEMELKIQDVYEQYKKAAEYFSEIPRHITVIISPGNHDAVRQAEPQPMLPENIRADFSENVTFVGNPSVVDLDGVKLMIYHGRSIDDLVASIPGVSYQEPTKAMVEMMKRRHLSPIYGSRVSIAPEKQDHFVIGQVPDILHCGHVHTVGVEWYKNVLLVNSGTWQSQTEFQKRVNVVPTPAQVPIVDLSTLKTTILKFAE
ncbi:DNA-directed DNA polymerase II small subunit [Methanomethylovorans sp.]|uniref:DNA-directed DNA polymerase II small subunit n=1 Tax=Methanomethylovorans sp. TaxID=2758717 RepID=UPI00351CA63B